MRRNLSTRSSFSCGLMKERREILQLIGLALVMPLIKSAAYFTGYEISPVACAGLLLIEPPAVIFLVQSVRKYRRLSRHYAAMESASGGRLS